MSKIAPYEPKIVRKPEIEILEVKPETAEHWLMFNDDNQRNIRPNRVSALARDMIEQRYDLTGASIVFDWDGRLIDGQHRLSAVVEAGVSITVPVMFGANPDTRHTIDTGAKRSMGDILKISGLPNGPRLAGLLKAVWQWEHDYFPPTRDTPTSQELRDVLVKHPELPSFVRQACFVIDVYKVSPTVISLAMWLFTEIDEKDNDAFWQSLVNGGSSDEGDPIRALVRNYLRFSSGKLKPRSYHVLALTIKAWNYYRTGRGVNALVYRDRGGAPEPFPKPV